jgi:tRNA-dihydrouridine synthase C
MPDLFPADRPALWLAPMQDVTNLAFLRAFSRRDEADACVTEYFRVHPESQLDRHILRVIEDNPTGRPIIAQLIGSDAASLVRAARQLSARPVAAVDLNLGCPAPVVCRKHAGGGLLRQPDKIDIILTELRAAIPGRFTVKSRVGFHSPDEFPRLLEIFARHRLDAVTIHARTVADGYRTAVRPECVRAAVAALACPVIANGNVVDVPTGLALLARTGAAGLMIGRGAIRNPWLFGQLRAAFAGQRGPAPTSRDVLGWVIDLHQECSRAAKRNDPRGLIAQLKKAVLFVTQGYPKDFEYRLRRAVTEEEFFAICGEFLDHDEPVPPRPNSDSTMFRGFAELV